MKLPFVMRSALLGAFLLFPACQDEEEECGDAADDSTPLSCQEAVPEQPEKDINAVNEYGKTKLAQVALRLRNAEDALREAMADTDEEDIEYYRQRVAKEKARTRELLRAGADPWARSLCRGLYDSLAPCARQSWSPEFVEELRREGFIITDTPPETNSSTSPQ